jgi:ribonuclease HI
VCEPFLFYLFLFYIFRESLFFDIAMMPHSSASFLEHFVKDQRVNVFIDGACSGNPGPGGWGALFLQGSHTLELSGGEANTTNNRMELRAAIEALSIFPEKSLISLTTDSQYVKSGIELWIQNWKKNHWTTANKKQVKNKELWERLDQLCQKHTLSWTWVRGHNGHDGNERADALARQGLARAILGVNFIS